MNAAAVIAIKRRRIIQAFRDAGATSAEKAMPLGALGIPNHLLTRIQKLRGVLVQVAGDRYYLDEVREAEVSRLRRRIAWTVGVVALIIAGLIWYYSK